MVRDIRERDVWAQCDGRVFLKYPTPVVMVEEGKTAPRSSEMGMPGPVIPGAKSTRRNFITNVRNTASRHWTPWLAGSEVVVGKDKSRGGRCLVPVAAFSEPDENTNNPRILRKRADDLPFFFAGVWGELTGDHGTIKQPNVGKHRLFTFLTTSAAPEVQPYHSKATQLILRNPRTYSAGYMARCWMHLSCRSPPKKEARLARRTKSNVPTTKWNLSSSLRRRARVPGLSRMHERQRPVMTVVGTTSDKTQG